jgi:pilus assembly protein FimV
MHGPKPTAAVARVSVAKGAPPAAPAPLPLGAATPPNCARPDPALLKTCVALDYKNARLTEEIGHLEDKVKVLQMAMGAAPAAVSAPSPAPRPANATPRVVPLQAKPTKSAPPPAPAFPWLWLALGGALLLGVGARVFHLLRRKAAREREAKAEKASQPAVMPGVKNRLMPEKGELAAAAATADSARE